MRILLCILLSLHVLQAQPEVGVAVSIKEAGTAHAAGFGFLVATVPEVISPFASDQEFATRLRELGQLKTPVYALNIFIPAEIKLVGATTDEGKILHYTQKVFERCRQANIKLIVWGSGGARKIPTDFSKAEATTQFIEIARKVADQAAQQGIVLALENLNTTETNFINTVAEALEIVKAVNRKNFRLCADIYHMLREGEPAATLLRCKGYLVHIDLAEKENRSAPGVHREDFTAYLKALKKIKYSGKLVLECRWDNWVAQAGPSRLYLQQQIDQVWK
ncbi:MAG: sugar phosphate isomerase/epimerase [Cyclobacteriaceae bacterium]|nr:sugar phosphate isomerase/epimerase [Cyclobacteriaceae bacterium]